MMRSGWRQSNRRAAPHLIPGEFNRFLSDHGTTVQWYSVRMCPCRGAKSDHPNELCSKCHGWGFFWVDPVEIKGAGLGDSAKLMFEAFGQHTPGDLMLTFPTKTSGGVRVLAGGGDRFYFPERTEIQHRWLTKGEQRINQATAERIYSPAVSRVLSCSTVTSDFIHNTDYTLTPDSSGQGTVVNWIDGGAAPDEGQDYTITFESCPFYHANDKVKFRGEGGRRQVQLLLLHKVTAPSDLLNMYTPVSAEGAA